MAKVTKLLHRLTTRYLLVSDRKIIKIKHNSTGIIFLLRANYTKSLLAQSFTTEWNFWRRAFTVGGLISSLAVTNPGWMTAINYPSSSLRRMQIYISERAWCINFCGRVLLGGTDKRARWKTLSLSSALIADSLSHTCSFNYNTPPLDAIP